MLQKDESRARPHTVCKVRCWLSVFWCSRLCNIYTLPESLVIWVDVESLADVLGVY